MSRTRKFKNKSHPKGLLIVDGKLIEVDYGEQFYHATDYRRLLRKYKKLVSIWRKRNERNG